MYAAKIDGKLKIIQDSSAVMVKDIENTVAFVNEQEQVLNEIRDELERLMKIFGELTSQIKNSIEAIYRSWSRHGVPRRLVRYYVIRIFEFYTRQRMRKGRHDRLPFAYKHANPAPFMQDGYALRIGREALMFVFFLTLFPQIIDV